MNYTPVVFCVWCTYLSVIIQQVLCHGDMTDLYRKIIDNMRDNQSENDNPHIVGAYEFAGEIRKTLQDVVF